MNVVLREDERSLESVVSVANNVKLLSHTLFFSHVQSTQVNSTETGLYWTRCVES